MFTPIKNLLTYIQNASGSPRLRRSPISKQDTQGEDASKYQPNNQDNSLKSIDDLIIDSKMSTTNNDNSKEVVEVNRLFDDDVDDIELQIKSSVMMRKPSTTVDTTITTASTTNSDVVVPFMDQDDELDDFRHEPVMHAAHNSSVDEFSSAEDALDDNVEYADEAEEILGATADEDEIDDEETFLDLPQRMGWY